MRPILLFVHGTGVRHESYVKTLDAIREQVSNLNLEIDVAGCFWGGSTGAILAAGGASIPDYVNSGGRPPTQEDQVQALWLILLTDPWYELRLLANQRYQHVFGQGPPGLSIRLAFEALVDSEPANAAFKEARMTGLLPSAVQTLISSKEFAECIATATGDALAHRRAAARAIVAWSLVQSSEGGGPLVDSVRRDRLISIINDELNAEGLSIGEAVLRQVKGIALRLVTRKLVADRGSITDSASPMAGDVLRYLARGQYARTFIKDRIAALGDRPIHLLAHSLGGIMCTDVLIEQPHPNVSTFTTVGTQVPFLYEIDALPLLSFPQPLPKHMPRWLNIFDRSDILSYQAEPIFPGRVTDFEVHSGLPFHWSHSAYWESDTVWHAIREFLA